jgi:hypothetical protein
MVEVRLLFIIFSKIKTEPQLFILQALFLHCLCLLYLYCFRIISLEFVAFELLAVV